jgi:hypothetical protein
MAFESVIGWVIGEGRRSVWARHRRAIAASKELAVIRYVITARSPALPWFGAIAYHGFP